MTPGRAWCEGEGLSLRDKDWLRGDALEWRRAEAGRPGLRGAEGLAPAWALPVPGLRRPVPGCCLGRRSGAVADPGGFCSWSLLESNGRQEERPGHKKQQKDRLRILQGPVLGTPILMSSQHRVDQGTDG